MEHQTAQLLRAERRHLRAVFAVTCFGAASTLRARLYAGLSPQAGEGSCGKPVAERNDILELSIMIIGSQPFADWNWRA